MKRMRRRMLQAGLAAAVAQVVVRPAVAQETGELAAAVARFAGGRPVQAGRVKLDIASLVDNGNVVLSHVQCGFNFFNPHGHEGKKETRHTITIYGSQGSMGMVGYDWEPLGVDLATKEKPTADRQVTDSETEGSGPFWTQCGALTGTWIASPGPISIGLPLAANSSRHGRLR